MSEHRTKVLLVDDNRFVVEFVQSILPEQEFEIVCLEDPVGFGRVVVQEKPDLVLMDVSMPALRGDKLAEIALRSGLHRCPIVLFSDLPEPALAKLVGDCGAAGYIQKSRSPELLAIQLRRFLRR